MRRLEMSGLLRTSAILLGLAIGGGVIGSAVAQDAPKDLAALEAAAKAEGGVVNFYSNIADAEPLFDAALKAKYPFMKVQVFGGSPGDIRAKFITEMQAGLPSADVVIATLADVAPYRKLGAVAPVTLPNDSQMPAGLAVLAPEFHALWQTLYVMEYNTDAGLDVPHDPYELADPKWKGLITFDRPSNAGAAGAFLASRKQLWGDEKWEKWLAGLKANEISITPSANNTYASVLQGEYPVGLGGLQDVLNQAQGAPVAPMFYDNVVVNQNFGVVSKLAPHPASAALFINWLMSEDGQKVFADSGRIPARLIDSPMSLDRLVPSGVTPMPVATMQDWIDNAQDYITKFKELWPE
jgi:iron(III) transport system substrate-binding protein